MSDTEHEVVEGAEAKPAGVNMWRRDFKIMGQINDQKGLSFNSLCGQIESGIRKGYGEPEIIDVVIRAINTSLKLRGYLESRSELTLTQLRSIIRAHFGEKSTTELYQQLSSLVQNAREDPQDFLMRSLELREKVKFASTDDPASLHYDSELVDGMFRRAVLTGLQSDTIRLELRDLLANTGVSDLELIKAMSVASTAESERLSKLGKKSKGAINSAGVENIETASIVEGKFSKKDKKQQAQESDLNLNSEKSQNDNVILKEIASLRVEVSELKSRLDNKEEPLPKPCVNQVPYVEYGQNVYNNAGVSRPYPYYPPPVYPIQRPSNQRLPSGCPNCRKEGGNPRCRHCWFCGSPDHFKVNCDAAKQYADTARQHAGNY